MQYTIRSVPEHVDRALREKAELEKKSLNTILLEALEQAAHQPERPVIHHDLDFLIGSWVDDPEFDEAMKQFEKIDEEIWK
ncbi:hypothetical protein SH661x_004186 [Planctomicrobium sp. SH661]|uniref:hypothetical protein n=1 Tax=Planctomicrobium sp. SH661 TaxID=3448124 RepID=UPI003F5C2D7B